MKPCSLILSIALLGLVSLLAFSSGCREKRASTKAEVVSQMLKHANERHYGDAIKVGEAWLREQPEDDFVCMQVALVYLAEAKSDIAHRELFIDDATQFANRALKVQPNGLATVQSGAAMFESAGDLSENVIPEKKCERYRRALELAEREGALLGNGGRIPNPENVQQLARSTIARVHSKLNVCR